MLVSGSYKPKPIFAVAVRPGTTSMPQTCHWDGQSVGPQWVDSACSSAAIADVQQHSGCLTDNVDFSPETRRWTGASLGARDDRYVAVTERSRRSHEQQQPLHNRRWHVGPERHQRVESSISILGPKRLPVRDGWEDFLRTDPALSVLVSALDPLASGTRLIEKGRRVYGLMRYSLPLSMPSQ